MATLDTRIALGAEAPDVVGSMAKGMQLRDMAAMGQMRDLQRQQAQMQIDDANAQRASSKKLSDLWAGNIGPDGKVNRQGMLSSMASSGLGSQIPGMQKQFADQDKADAEVKNLGSQIDERNIGTIKKRLDLTGSALSSLLANPNVTPQDALNSIQGLVNSGAMSHEEGAQAWREVPTGNPQALRQYLLQKGMQIMEAGKRIEMMTPKVEMVDTGGERRAVDTNPMTNAGVVGQTFKRTMTPAEVEAARHNRIGEGISAGQLNVAQQRLALDQQAPKGQIVQTENGPVLADPRSGKATPLMGPDGQPLKGVAKAPTEFQGKSAMFGARARAADEVLGSVAGQYSPAALAAKRGADDIPLIGGMAGAAVNAVMSPESQRAEQAQRDFINAVLRQESGASIASSEFDNARKQYFPQPGDTPAVIAQKAQNRQLVIAGLEKNAGAAVMSPEGEAPQPKAKGVAKAPAWRDAGYQSQAAVVNDAMTAISKGADKAAVIRRLEEAGITNHGIK